MSQHEAHASSFEELYIKERKKARIFMATAGLAVALMTGSIVYAGTKKAPRPEGPIKSFSSDGEMSPLRVEGPGGDRGLRMAMDIESFFSDDGSVDTDQVNDMLEHAPEEFRDNMLERMESQIDEAVEDGDITEAQASALKSAFGITGDPDES